MKVINLTRKPMDRQMVKRQALESDTSIVIDEPTIAKCDGKVVFIYDVIKHDTSELASRLQRVKMQTNKRSSGLNSTSRVFGYKPRNARNAGQDFCSEGTLNAEEPKAYKQIEEVARAIAKNYKFHRGEKYEEHMKLTEKVLKQWVIKGTPFTSGILNKNNALKYHYDTGNFKDVFSCMLMLRRDLVGGDLSMPEFNVKVKLANNSLFMFDGQGVIHGVTPIAHSSNQGYRYTLVFYSLQQMWSCRSIGEELERVRAGADAIKR